MKIYRTGAAEKEAAPWVELWVGDSEADVFRPSSCSLANSERISPLPVPGSGHIGVRSPCLRASHKSLCRSDSTQGRDLPRDRQGGL